MTGLHWSMPKAGQWGSIPINVDQLLWLLISIDKHWSALSIDRWGPWLSGCFMHVHIQVLCGWSPLPPSFSPCRENKGHTVSNYPNMDWTVMEDPTPLPSIFHSCPWLARSLCATHRVRRIRDKLFPIIPNTEIVGTMIVLRKIRASVRSIPDVLL